MSKDQNEEKPGCTITLLIPALIAVAIGLGILARVWLFYFAGGLFFFLVWWMSTRANPGEDNPAGILFAWQAFAFLAAGIFLTFEINPFASYWQKPWPALALLALFLVFALVISLGRMRGWIGFFIVTAGFCGILANLLAILIPPEEAASQAAMWIDRNSVFVAIGCYALAFLLTGSQVLLRTTKQAKLPYMRIYFYDETRQIRKELKTRKSQRMDGVLMEQVEKLCVVVLIVLGYLLGLAVWLLGYLKNWLQGLPKALFDTLVSILEEALTFFRFVLLQVPLHLLAAGALWVFSAIFYNYLFLQGSVFILLFTALVAFLALVFCFFAGLALIIGSTELYAYLPAWKGFLGSMQLLLPQILFVAVCAAWGLILLSQFMDTLFFQIGALTITSTFVLVCFLAFFLIQYIYRITDVE